MKKFLTSVLSMVLCMSLLCGITSFAAANPDVAVWEASSRIMISGQVEAAKAGQYATIMLVKKDADFNNLQYDDVGYLNQIEILEGGYYKFVTTIDKVVSTYELKMNIAGEDVTQSVISATTDNTMIATSFDIDRGLDSADINVAFSNELLVAGKKYTVIATYYDENGKMITSDVKTETEISAESLASSVKVPTTYAEGAKTMKVFIWDMSENAIPLCGHEEIEIAAPLTVACWGDSLTHGVNDLYDADGNATGEKSTPYPTYLADMLGNGYTVYNMGVGGETATTIAARQGALDILVSETFIIPAGTSAVEFKMEASNGGVVVPRALPDFWKNCTIAGVEGTLSISVNSNEWPRTLSWAKFTRKEAGAAVVVPAGTKFIPDAQKVNGDINIFFTGTNGGWTVNHEEFNQSDENCEALVELIKQQIAHTGKSKYIVIGLTFGYTASTDNINKYLAEAFGDNFLDAKSYLASEQALTDAGITATEDDLKYIAGGHIPTSLLIPDRTHFTSEGYELIAQQVYAKMIELGYCVE